MSERIRRELLWAFTVIAVFLILAILGAYHGTQERKTNERLAILDVCEGYFYDGGADMECPQKMREYLDEVGE